MQANARKGKARQGQMGLTWQALLKAIEFWFAEDLVAGHESWREVRFRSQGSATFRRPIDACGFRVK